MQKLTVRMDAKRQRTQLRALQQQVDLFVQDGEVMLLWELNLNQAHIIVAGDDARPGSGGQHTLDAGRTLFWLIAAAQLQVDIAAGNRLQCAGVQHRSSQTRQFTGFIQP